MAHDRGNDAREHPRARARIRVEYNFGATVGAGYTRDVSEGEIFLVCSKIAEPGARIYLRLHLPGSRAGEPLKVVGKVTRASRRFAQRSGGEPQSGQGMGIRFEVVYARTREALHELVQGILAHADVEPIEPVPGSHPGEPTYAVRLAKNAGQLSAEEVSQAFAFDAPTEGELSAAKWDRLGTVTWRLAVGLLVLGALAYFVASIAVMMR